MRNPNIAEAGRLGAGRLGAGIGNVGSYHASFYFIEALL